jgi:predicted ArsR family transcriptional regulator
MTPVADDDFEAQVSGVAALNDPIRRALYQFVVQSADAVSREQAAEGVGVQRALAAFHLDKLAEEGLLDFEFRRLTGRSGPGAGRPAKLYRRSARQIDVSLPPREYDVAALLFAQAIEEAGAKGDVRAALGRVSFAFGERMGADAEARAGSRASNKKRREALVAVLGEHGFEPHVIDGEVVLANCPFHALAQQFTDLVCGMNLQLMEGVRSRLTLQRDALQPQLAPEAGLCCVRFCSAA